jgi:hypothetical protein
MQEPTMLRSTSTPDVPVDPPPGAEEGSPPPSSGPRGIPLSAIWVALALLLPLTVALAAHLSTIDLGYLVRSGQVMLGSGEVLRADAFTFTALCDPWLNQQWGVEVLLAGTFGALGWFGLAALRGALAVGVVAFTFAACRAGGAQRRTAAWLTLLSWIPHLGPALRAQFFGMLLFAALLWLVTSRHSHPRRLAWAIPILLVWANAHGSFPFGILVLGLAWLEDAVTHRSSRRTLVVAVLAALATLLTPFGPRVWTYALDLSADPLIREVIREWQPPWVYLPMAIAFGISATVAVWAFVRNRRELAWPAWLQLAIFLALAATSMRGMFWWMIVLAVTLARLPWAARAPRQDPRHPANALMVAVVAVLPLVALARWVPHTGNAPPEDLLRFAPVALTGELRSALEPGEPFANPQAWGSWFELTLPSHPVWVDARIEVVPEAVRGSIQLQMARPGWQETLEELPVRILVVDRYTQGPLVQAMAANEGWRVIYEDADGLIFERVGGQPAEPLAPCP